MAESAYQRYQIEMAASREAERAGDLDRAIHFLERAHILGQRYLIPHLATHWRMLRLARRHGDPREIRGQIARLFAALPGYLFGWVPVGNTGGANVSAIQPMPIPPDLAPYFIGYSVWTGIAVRVALLVAVTAAAMFW